MYRSSVTLVASPFINIFTFFFTTTCSRFNIRTQRLLRLQHTSDRIKVFHVRGVLLHSYRATEVIIKRAHVTSTAFVFFWCKKCLWLTAHVYLEQYYAHLFGVALLYPLPVRFTPGLYSTFPRRRSLSTCLIYSLEKHQLYSVIIII